MRSAKCALLGICVFATSLPSAMAGDDAGRVEFSRDIRPILSNSCFTCHGPDQGQRQADLRLDIKDGLYAEREGGKAVVPNSLEHSLIYERITSSDPDMRMPPADAARQLTPEQIELIRRWIEQGAEWQGHWSFVPPKKPEVPATDHPEQVRNAIDHFIQARLKEQNWTLSPEAEKEALLRRATIDLTGLPPTIAEIDAFLADDSENAYEKVVNRLLDSPRYGEQMAHYWLDAARYGDTHGLHLDNERSLWPYRDWVISAFNRNLPFDQFTIWQLAGDLLPESTQEQLIATGFNRCNVSTSEGGAIPEEYRMKYCVDRVETMGTVFMGLTVGCAACHDHKFDPITQKEFYSLYAYFNNIAENPMDGNALLPPPVMKVPNSEQQSQRDQFAQQLAELDRQMAERSSSCDVDLSAWEQKAVADLGQLPALPADAVARFTFDEGTGENAASSLGSTTPHPIKGKADWVAGRVGKALMFDGKTHIETTDIGNFERTDKFSYGGWVRTDAKESMALLSKMDESLGIRGYDLYLGGGKVYVHLIHKWEGNAIRLNTKDAFEPGQWHHLMVTYDGSSQASGIKVYVDGTPRVVQVTHDNLSDTIRVEKPLRIGRRDPAAPFKGAIDDVWLFNRVVSEAEVARLASLTPVEPILVTAAASRTAEQIAAVRTYYLENVDEAYRKLVSDSTSAKTKRDEFENTIPSSMIMRDEPQARETFVLVRGAYDKPGDKVEAGVPASLPALPADAPKNRLTLARWLVDPGHPLTARVMVNRMWQHYFGSGIVKTAEDFGAQGAQPTHPALLDWLAVDFVESGWDLKRMAKLMVMSSTYRQTSRVTPEMAERDPENIWLARGPRFRMDAETIRDGALAASGLLVEQLGGKSVKPYQPDGVWEAVAFVSSNTKDFKRDDGPALYRRSMYTFWKRTAPPPSLMAFDAPSRESCSVRRARTNTPLQALALMNDVQYVEAARKMGERMLLAGGTSDAEKLYFGFRLATGRRPNESEIAVLLSQLQLHRTRFQQDSDAAGKLIATGQAPRDESIAPAELAAWTMIANLILNLDETVTKG